MTPNHNLPANDRGASTPTLTLRGQHTVPHRERHILGFLSRTAIPAFERALLDRNPEQCRRLPLLRIGGTHLLPAARFNLINDGLKRGVELTT